MKWEDRQESENVEDRRGLGTGTVLAGGGGIVAVVVFVVAQFLGVDPDQAKKLAEVVNQQVGQPQQGGPQQGGPQRKASPEEERMAKFSRVVLHDTEIVWDDLFRKMGQAYEKPTLVFFTDNVSTGCGSADSGVGPFYCPRDKHIYIDLGFYTVMQSKLNAPGEFARAYVIAHEVGHHVQRLLHYSDIVDRIRQKGDPLQTNHASVRLELQADYLAGVWAHHGDQRFKFLEKGDIDAAVRAAFQIGDDNLQRKARGQVVPDTFTHGSSQQRMKWFMQGYKTGSVEGAADLFKLQYNEL
jgi:predicted metalloprotease